MMCICHFVETSKAPVRIFFSSLYNETFTNETKNTIGTIATSLHLQEMLSSGSATTEEAFHSRNKTVFERLARATERQSLSQP